jgi:hypothetical protein
MMSEAQYLAMEARSPIRHVFIDGELFATAGAKPGHHQLAVTVPFRPLLGG